VERIQKQAATAGKSRDALEKEKEKDLRAKAKADEEKRAKEEAALFKPVQVQKVPFGVDPKTVLCAFFKAGACDKGNKCKFSHDLDIGRRVEKRNLYEDDRDNEEKMQGALRSSTMYVRYLTLLPIYTDTMENWDEEKLRSVVLSKAGNPRTTTDVISFSNSYPMLYNLPFRLYANTSLKRLKFKNLDGSGNVRTVKCANTDTPFHQASSLNLRRRRQRMWQKQIKSAWRSS
jgi:hypothetical protein